MGAWRPRLPCGRCRVEGEPARESALALLGASVDCPVGPAGEHCADEALGFAVGPWPVGPCPQVPDPKRSTSERVDGRAVGGGVVGHHPLDADAVGGEVGDRSSEEADSGDRTLIGEHLDVGKSGCIVDADVHVFPSDASRLAPAAAGDTVASAIDPGQLLDVDMQQLARASTLVAVRWLRTLERRELAQTDAGEDRRHSRARHRQHLGDLRPAHPQPTQGGDRLDPILPRSRGIDRGAAGRSSRPASPSRRYRAKYTYARR